MIRRAVRVIPQRWRGGVLCWMFLVLGAGICAGQEISGFVKDVSGAVVPGVTITATHVATRVTRTSVSNPAGYYVIPEVPIGEYDIVAELPGFKRFLEAGVVVRVDSHVSVHPVLELGSVTEEVVVRADAALVNANTGQVARIVTGDQAVRLQLNGRNYSQLLWLNPGVSSTVRSGSELFGGFGSIGIGQSINGGRTSAQSWNIDGVDNKDNGGGGNNFVNVNPDAIAEFAVLTTNFGAEHGQNAGAVINVALKSGTRDVRGVGYGYFRHDALDAAAFNALTKPRLRYHNFGGNVGGPVSLGRFNRDRTRLFFFGALDYKRQRLGTPTTWTVPTLAERQGNLATLPPSQWPVDPATGQPVPGGLLPADLISPDAARLIANYPIPNFAGPGGNFQFNNATDQDVAEQLLKLDYVVSPTQQLAFNYLHDSFGGVQNTTQLAVYDRRVPGFSSSIRWKAILSTHAVNTLQVSASGNRIVQNGVRSNPAFERDVTRSGAGITYPTIYGASDMIPSIAISGACCTALSTTAALFQNFNHVFGLRDDFSRVIRNHTVKAGVLMLKSLKNQDNQPPVNGAFTFDNLGQALVGSFSTYTEGAAGREGWFRFWQHELYIADSWKVQPRLTIDAGVRYNLLQPQYSALNNAVVFVPALYDRMRAPDIDPVTGEIVRTPAYDPNNGLAVGGDEFPEAARSRIPNSDSPVFQNLFRGLPTTLIDVQAGLGPRLSAAYDVSGNQAAILRGGYGRFFERIQGNYIFNSVNNPPFVLSTTVFGGDVESPSSGRRLALPPNVRSFDIRMKLPTVDNWSVGVQGRATSRGVAEVAYVGARGFNQTRDADLNQLAAGTLQQHPGVNANALRPYPGYAAVNQYVTDARYWYHSLQSLFKLTMPAGGFVQTAYTYSRAVTTATNWNTLPVDSYNPDLDKGPADYDRPHVFVASYVYPLPFFSARRGWSRLCLGDWRVSGVTTLQSGLPLNVMISGDRAGIGRALAAAGSNGQRPDLVGEPDLSRADRTWTRWFNTAAFAQPAAGTFGTLPRNALRGPGTINTDLSVHKLVRFSGRRSAELRLEAFNVFNHANPYAIGNVVGTATFGQVTQFADPRILQLAVRANF